MTVLNRARCVLIKLTQILKVTHFPAFHADLTSWVGNGSTHNDYQINAPPTWTFLIVTTGSLRTGSLTWTAPILWSWIVTCAAPWHVTASAGLWTSGPFAPDSPFSINWHWNETREKHIIFLVSFCSCSLLLLRSLPQICYVTRAKSGYKRDYDLITIHWRKTGCRRKFTPLRNSEVSIYMGHECIIVTWYIPNQRIVVFVLDRDNNLLSIRSYTPKLPFSTECWWIITRLRAIPHYQRLGTSASSLAGKNEASWALRVRERSARV